MKNKEQIESAKELLVKVQDYVVLAQAQKRLKEQNNKEDIEALLNVVTEEAKELAKVI